MLATAPGCAIAVRSASSGLAVSLARAVANHDDTATVRDGAPALLLVADAMIEADPLSPERLLDGSRLYGTYAMTFVTDPERARRLTERSRSYAERATCLLLIEVCGALRRPFAELRPRLDAVPRRHVAALYALGTSWTSWISLRTTDWNAVAELPKVEAIMTRVIALDDAHDGGGAHAYLGALLSQRPQSMGGKPDVARAHFERALELSQQRNLSFKVLYAQHYARLVFDRELHDRLLQEVVAADPRAPDLTLANRLAQDQARALLASADSYF